MRFAPLPPMVAAVFFSLSCDNPVEPGNTESALTAEVSALLVSGGQASGHVEVQGTPVQNVQDESYSFTAISTDAFPLARGQVQVHILRFTGQEVKVHADVTCLSVENDQAWVGSRVQRFVVDGEDVPEAVGRSMIFRVLDLGEGEAPPDQASLVFFTPPGGDITHCTTRPEFPILRQSRVGNIQVKQDGI